MTSSNTTEVPSPNTITTGVSVLTRDGGQSKCAQSRLNWLGVYCAIHSPPALGKKMTPVLLWGLYSCS
jgi:hypothetical protein